ncbi:hypothetical protein ABR965_21360, partial [Photorhabdus laumondii]
MPTTHHPSFNIENRGPAPIRAVNYWAPPFGDYNQYAFIDIQPGETKFFRRVPNTVYFYKVVYPSSFKLPLCWLHSLTP